MFRDRALHALAQASDASQCEGSFPGIGKNRVVSIVPMLSWLAAFAGAVIAPGPRPLARAFVLDRLVRYVFILPAGLMGLWAALGHIVFPARVAQAIGWPPSPFQFEVGVRQSGDRLGWVIHGVPLVRSAARDQFGAGMFPYRCGRWSPP